MTYSQSSQDDIVAKLLNPKYFERVDSFKVSGNQFVQYSSAANIRKIIHSNELWLSNVRLMNDASEVSFGLERIFNYITQNHNLWLAAINGCNGRNDAEIIIQALLEKKSLVLNDTYIACFSEHEKSDEKDGKLSMWRSYGKNSKCPAALVINPSKLLQDASGFNAFFCPVDYSDKIEEEMNSLLGRIKDNQDKFVGVSQAKYINHIFLQILRIAVTFKHPGFNEEKEWRLIYSPQLIDSDYIDEEVEDIAGMPQVVQKIKFENGCVKSLFKGASIKSELSQVLIGPAANEVQLMVKKAFEKTMSECNRNDAMVQISTTPYRG